MSVKPVCAPVGFEYQAEAHRSEASEKELLKCFKEVVSYLSDKDG